MTSDAQELDNDFNYNMVLANHMVTYLQSAMDRQLVRRWLERLRRYRRSRRQMAVRNELMYRLARNLNDAALRPPFTEVPPSGPLEACLHQLSSDDSSGEEKEQKAPGKEEDRPWWEAVDSARGEQRPLVHDRSPDGGAFLAAQPVPRCGVFCYLAVVAKGKDGDKR
ncbi:uncharacterized protein LOC134535319 [Bacillus rossius redtenbacheri]|uniref:uncharacterized protein LOC134535319 n=1 Tax=Bacillus rossius redtenbacheri TaxID=93214 RepID=UPI002FDE329A